MPSPCCRCTRPAHLEHTCLSAYSLHPSDSPPHVVFHIMGLPKKEIPLNYHQFGILCLSGPRAIFDDKGLLTSRCCLGAGLRSTSGRRISLDVIAWVTAFLARPGQIRSHTGTRLFLETAAFSEKQPSCSGGIVPGKAAWFHLVPRLFHKHRLFLGVAVDTKR